MKIKVVAGIIFLSLLAGCKAKSGAGLPSSDFQGKVPDEINQKLLALNELPTESMRGATAYAYYDEKRALLTITHRLRSSRWAWSMNKSDIEPSIIANTCDRFSEELYYGAGIRNWFAGSGGFVTKTITADDCTFEN
ncbi:hypothetical protein CS022_00290 [Veronia nyctiphanis]|uniref:Uncharacterized protein n=1 Tax=Veronia nyctiphanis TaxID=1278244 RepID=A0A4V1LTC5_9GAMM|nr:hypothetical protein [Veronia nyctiphanis]RXJ74718.1 hypothetical protein CS022_00290 [Veronia nyctiphanis]